MNSDRTYKYVVIGLMACSMLMYEILLTRICALRLMFHFAFLVISVAMLGFGAAGSFLTAWRSGLRSDFPGRTLAVGLAARTVGHRCEP